MEVEEIIEENKDELVKFLEEEETKSEEGMSLDTLYEVLGKAEKIVENWVFTSNNNCEPPGFVSLAYDVKKYLPMVIEMIEEHGILRRFIAKEGMFDKLINDDEFLEFLRRDTAFTKAVDHKINTDGFNVTEEDINGEAN